MQKIGRKVGTVHSLRIHFAFTSTPAALLSQLLFISTPMSEDARAFFRRWGRPLFHRPDDYPFRPITIIMIYPVAHLGNMALEKYFSIRDEQNRATPPNEDENTESSE